MLCLIVQSTLIKSDQDLIDLDPNRAYFPPLIIVLHSSGFHLLSVPKVKTHADTRAFAVGIPTL